MSQVATRTKAPKRAAGSRGPGVGGRRLGEAFEAVSRLPALAESRRRLIKLTEADASSPDAVADAVESDAALAIAVMRAANNGTGPAGRVGGVREAVEALSPGGVRVIVTEADTYDPFDPSAASPAAYERFRRHAVSTRHAADMIADAARLPNRDELAVAALFHDVGKLVLAQLHGDDEVRGDSSSETPEERVRRERRELGIDHGLVGAVLVRRWGLRPTIAAAIERHHARDAQEHAAALRLADGVVHHAAGDAISFDALVQAGGGVGLNEDGVRTLLFEFPHSGTIRRRPSDPCPLSMREIDALRGLAEGKVYKQIAAELSLSVSTIRTHLHNVYRKIGAVDRAQAVLIARDRGWI